MTFVELAQYLEKMEATSSRLSLIEILSDLFKHAHKSEIDEIIYLTQGRVGPFFDPTEIGMADKTVAEAIGKAYGVTKEEVLKLYDKKGDMGEVAQQLNEKNTSARHPELVSGSKNKMLKLVQHDKLSVTDVFNILTTIAHTGGAGSVEKKQTLLSDLLKKVDPISAKHLVRIPLGNSRLGVGDPTVLDGLATAKLGDKSKRKLLEKAYNETSDLGLIGKTLFEGGLEAVQKLKVSIGRPIRSELCERLPNPTKVFEKMDPAPKETKGSKEPKETGGEYGKKGVHATPKYDGFRCVTGFTPIYLKDKGITVARDLNVGDKVLTKTGDFKPVLAKLKRTIRKKEKLFSFRTYLGEEIRISEGHPLLCLEKGKEVWKNIELIKQGDEVIFPIPQFPPNNPHPAPTSLELQTVSGYKKTFDLNENFYRFLGFWIGDGFTNDFHNTERVGLTFNAKTEGKLADSYEKIIKQELQVQQVTRYLHNGGLNLYWRDEPLKHWLSTYFRRDWVGKMVPAWFSHVSKENFQQFLQGWIESDGHDKKGTTYITTKERDLASFAQLIALSHGIIIGLHCFRATVGNYKKTYYQLVIPKSTQKARIEQKRIIVKVRYNKEIKNRDPRITLYDIQVEGDESFCVPMATLHNCQIHKNGDKVTMFSRNLENMSHMFPELIEGTLKQVKAKTAILDTEALAYNTESEEFYPFQETTKRRRKHNIEEVAKTLPLRAFVFDVLYVDGKSLLDTPLLERQKVINKILHGDDILIPAPAQILHKPEELQLLLDDSISKGLEGVVVKRVDSLYEAGGRNFNWVKLKRHSSGELHDTIDCVVLGYIVGKGKRTEFGAGALLVGVYDKEKDEFVTVSRLGTGLTDDEWREIHKGADKIKVDHKPARVNSLIEPSVWIKPEIVVEILADEITRSPNHTAGMGIDQEGKKIPGYALRFPRLVAFRAHDKKPEDATTVDELIKMYSLQGKK